MHVSFFVELCFKGMSLKDHQRYWQFGMLCYMFHVLSLKCFFLSWCSFQFLTILYPHAFVSLLSLINSMFIKKKKYNDDLYFEWIKRMFSLVGYTSKIFFCQWLNFGQRYYEKDCCLPGLFQYLVFVQFFCFTFALFTCTTFL